MEDLTHARAYGSPALKSFPRAFPRLAQTIILAHFHRAKALPNHSQLPRRAHPVIRAQRLGQCVRAGFAPGPLLAKAVRLEPIVALFPGSRACFDRFTDFFQRQNHVSRQIPAGRVRRVLPHQQSDCQNDGLAHTIARGRAAFTAFYSCHYSSFAKNFSVQLYPPCPSRAARNSVELAHAF